VKVMQSSLGEPRLNCLLAESQRTQLSPGDDPMLSGRQLRQRPLPPLPKGACLT